MSTWLLQVLVLVGILCLVFVVIWLHHLYFEVLPRRAAKKYTKTDPVRLLGYLKRVAATRSLLGEGMKLIPHALLVNAYVALGRRAEAVDHCRAVLGLVYEAGDPKRLGSLKAEVRRTLADCLDALGRHDEAAKELRLATEQLRLDAAGEKEPPDNSHRYLTEGTLLERQNRHEEAYHTYEQALKVTPATNNRVRVQCMMHLVISAHHAGRIADCLSWAEKVIALGANGTSLRNAHRMAGLALANLGRLDESESYHRRAYQLAVAAGDKAAEAETLGSLAGCLVRRGKLAEAYEAAGRAAAVDPKGLRMSLAIQSEALAKWGRYEEALALCERYREGVPMDTAFRERRIQAVHALDIARYEANCGRVDDAWRHVEEALKELASDAKLGFRAEAVSCWILAARGLADESRGVSERVEARLGEFEGDPGTSRATFYDLGRAACLRGDHQAGIDYWTRYLALRPDPVYHPTALYFRGECYRQLGRTDDARNDYRAAVATNLDTHHARLARQQLGEITLL